MSWKALGKTSEIRLREVLETPLREVFGESFENGLGEVSGRSLERPVREVWHGN